MFTGMMLCLSGIAVLAMIHSVRSIIPGLSNLHSPPWRGNCQKNFPDVCTGITFCGAPGQCVNGKCQYKCYYCDCVNTTQCYFNAQKQVRCDCTGFGTTGDRCEIDIDECESEPCENGGSCINGVNSYTCLCPDGYTGTNCDENINDCDPDPCENGGTCNDGVNSFTCVCPLGYTGATCDIDINDCDPDPCENGGTCNDGVNSFTCVCPLGYTGATCDIDIDECESEPCENGGSCINGVNSYTCLCPDGYTGTNCDENINDCDPDPCENGGTCNDGVNSFTCVCPLGYTGATCDIDINDCDPDPCENGGTCNDGVNSFTCVCPLGYTGATCDIVLPRCTNEVNGFRLCDGGGVGVYHPMQGRLEVYHNDVWGTVCDDYWLDSHYRSNLTFAIPNANAACRTLGYSSGVPKPDAFFGQGVGNIWLDDVGCVGTEQSLYDCPHLPWGSHNCWHGEDIGVVCT